MSPLPRADGIASSRPASFLPPAPLHALLALLTGFALLGCGEDEDPPPSPKAPSVEDVARWNAGINAFDRYAFEEAAQIFEGIAEALPRLGAAWTNAAIARMNQSTPESFDLALAHHERALDRDGEDRHALHTSGILLKYIGRAEEAEKRFRALLALDPDDPTANYYLATLLVQRGEMAEAEALLKRSIANEPHQASAIFNLVAIRRREGQVAAARELRTLFDRLTQAEVGNLAGIVYSEMGRYGEAIRRFPLPVPSGIAASSAVSFERLTPAFEDQAPPFRPLAKPPGDAKGLSAWLARHLGRGLALADVDRDGDLDVWVADGEGVGVLWRNDDGELREDASALPKRAGGASLSAAFGDLDNDGWPDLVIACAGRNRLLMNREGRFEDRSEASGIAADESITPSLTLADLDSDGDIDIATAELGLAAELALGATWPPEGPGRPNRLWSNRRDGTFEDVAGLATIDRGERPHLGIHAYDYDDDRDMDLLLVPADAPPVLFRNDRLWRFTRVEDQHDLSELGALSGVLSADLDRDGSRELLSLPAPGNSRGARIAYGAAMHVRIGPFGPEGTHTGTVFDADRDGDLDLLLASEGAAELHLQCPRGTFEEAPGVLSGLARPGLTTVLAADLDADGAAELLSTDTLGRLVVHRGRLAPGARWLAIDLVGVREEGKMRANTGGLGAKVSAVSGERVQFADMLATSGVMGGVPARVAFGLGQTPEADYVSIRWPDDLLQGEAKISAGQVKTIAQVYRKSASCPLIFAWTGERMDFVTDALGTGGLGFFIAPGQYAQPDPTEAIALPKLQARNGQYRISVHEPMEEVVYLDRASLRIIDHPEGAEVWPDERLATAPPYPDGGLWVIRSAERLLPISLHTAQGEQNPTCLQTVDRVYQPGVRPDRRFLGYAEPQSLTVGFGAQLAASQGAGPLVLFLDGWVEYPYSHVNLAAGQIGLAADTLSVDAERSDGSFVKLLERFGYPAGMPRTMTAPLPALPEDATGRLRLRTNLELYVDRLWIAPHRPELPLSVVDRQASRAQLRSSGYPREFSPDGAEPLLYDYALMDPAIDFKTMAGAYTRFGRVEELLSETDDRMVIFGRAEEILLDFPALEGPRAGLQRRFVLDLFGWCKDMDLYTAWPRTLEPLPFGAMSTYPPPAGEHFPETPELERWRREWQTRHLSAR